MKQAVEKKIYKTLDDTSGNKFVYIFFFLFSSLFIYLFHNLKYFDLSLNFRFSK